MFDLLIRNAMLFDGTGSPPVHASLGVSAGRICALGEVSGAAHRVVEADGLALMPGIIDNHTHYDAQITWDPGATPSPASGVTTAVIGNCGFTIAPCRPADRDRVMRNLTQVEGMSLDVLRQGIHWGFQTIPEYLAQLESQGSVPNLAAFAGHSSIRTWVMGEAATERTATDEEIARMQAVVREAMQAGAIGFATSTSPAHNGADGIPMPSRLADERELRALVGAMGESGRGVFMLTKGGHTGIDFLESLAAQTGRPVVVAALLHNPTNPELVFRELSAIAQANERGRTLHGAVSCCPLTMDFTLRSPYPVEGLSAWRPALSLKGEALRSLLAQPGFRDAIRAELSREATVRLFNGQWDQVQVVEVQDPAHADMEHHSIGDLARARGKDPLDLMLDLALAEDLQTVFTATLLNADETAVGRMINHPNSLVSLSDAGAHLTFFNDAAFGLHLMGHWSRDRQVLPLASAVHRLTGQPAAVFGLHDRGVLRVGAAADLLLFDPARVGRGPKRRVHDLPGGAPRLHTDALGVHGVWVNGVQVAGAEGSVPVAHDTATARPGRLLRSGSH